MQSLANNPILMSQLQTQVEFLTELGQKAFDLVRRLSEMNLQLARQLTEDTMKAGQELLSCSDPVQMTTIAFNNAQPATEHLRNYQQQLMSVLGGAGFDLPRGSPAAPQLRQSTKT